MTLQWLRSLVFNVCMYLAMAVLAIVYLPYALVSREGAYAACHTYCRWVIWSEKPAPEWEHGLRCAERPPPTRSWSPQSISPSSTSS